MKKWLRLFAGGFWVTVIVVSVLAAMFYCSNDAQMVMANESARLFAVSMNDDTNAVSLTLMGDRYSLNVSPAVQVESLRRQYYYLLPMSVKLMEQAVCHTANEISALANGKMG